MSNDFHKNLFESITKSEDDFLLTELNAKKGEIKTREDLKRFCFVCNSCKKTRNGAEAVLLMTPLDIKYKNENDSVHAEVSQKMGLICKSCSNIIGEEKMDEEGKFKKWIKNRSVDGLFTEHYIFELIEEAKKEFPKTQLGLCDIAEPEKGKCWHIPSYKDVEEWFKKWFGE